MKWQVGSPKKGSSHTATGKNCRFRALRRTDDDVDKLVNSLTHEGDAGGAPAGITNGVVDGLEAAAITTHDSEIRDASSGESENSQKGKSENDSLHVFD